MKAFSRRLRWMTSSSRSRSRRKCQSIGWPKYFSQTSSVQRTEPNRCAASNSGSSGAMWSKCPSRSGSAGGKTSPRPWRHQIERVAAQIFRQAVGKRLADRIDDIHAIIARAWAYRPGRRRHDDSFRFAERRQERRLGKQPEARSVFDYAAFPSKCHARPPRTRHARLIGRSITGRGKVYANDFSLAGQSSFR